MTKFFHPRRLLSCGAVLLCLFGGPRLAVAQALDIPKSIQVPAQPLGDALRLLAKQADVQVLFAPRLVEGRTAPAVAGKFTTREALDRLLSGTNLAALEQSPGVIIVLKRAPRADRGSPKVPAIPAVTVAAVDIPTDTELQEVRVTAQRREERVQDVPISVSAYSRTVLDAQGARGIDDLARITPGVTFVRGANNNSESSDIAIRGIGSNAGAATTGVYIDDTPIQTRHLSFPSFNTYPALFDLERVEVLRGPARNALRRGFGRRHGPLPGAGTQPRRPLHLCTFRDRSDLTRRPRV
ncbi:MAG: TonB-dependent receptor plug domain-containing protein [Gammaproteobacteria bacterium]